MYFLEHQKENPDFLNEYLKYYCFIEFASTTTVNEKYFDLRTFFRYIKYKFHNQKFESIDEFKMFSIDDITLNDMNNVKPYIIDDFIFFLRNTLDNSPETRNRKLATLRKFFRYLFNNNLIDNNPTESSKMADVKISRRTVQYIVEQELDKLYKNERNGLHTHSLRHTTATLLYNENGTDIMLIKEILGHENISSTEIYTHINNKKLKEIMEKYSVSSILEKKENLENGK